MNTQGEVKGDQDQDQDQGQGKRDGERGECLQMVYRSKGRS